MCALPVLSINPLHVLELQWLKNPLHPMWNYILYGKSPKKIDAKVHVPYKSRA
jgi:hypothetical protein